MTTAQLRRRLLDRLAIYLPLVLMGLLAMGSYWLLRATPEPVLPQPARPLSHEPDYTMRGFSVKTYDGDGRLRTEVYGSEARHYPDDRTVEIDQARIRNLSPEGALTVARATRVTSNDDQSEYLLQGNASVVREAARLPGGATRPRLEFQGESLRVRPGDNRIESDRPVLLRRGNDQLSGDRLRYDDQARVAELSGRVKATLLGRP